MSVAPGHLCYSKDSAANVVRFAKAAHKEAPYILQGVASLSATTLPRAEVALHKTIAGWGMPIPLNIYFWNRGLHWAPMLQVQTWFEYLLVRRPSVLLGGFTRDHPARPIFLRAFWKAFWYDEPTHEAFGAHGQCLERCIPVYFYSDEGRGLRKAPVQVCGLETVFGHDSFTVPEELQDENLDERTYVELHGRHKQRFVFSFAATAICSASQVLQRQKKNTMSWQVCAQVGLDLARAFTTGITVGGEQWFLVLIGVKGDQPALNKAGRFTRTFQHLQGDKGVCFHCLAGQAGLPWEDLTSQAHWRNTLYAERPWVDFRPSCCLPVPYSREAPERMFRSDPMHLLKLGVGRHFLASSIIVLGDYNVWPGSSESVEKLLLLSHSDFVWCCKNEIQQTPNLKGFTKDLLHWPRRSAFPWGGLLVTPWFPRPPKGSKNWNPPI